MRPTSLLVPPKRKRRLDGVWSLGRVRELVGERLRVWEEGRGEGESEEVSKVRRQVSVPVEEVVNKSRGVKVRCCLDVW